MLRDARKVAAEVLRAGINTPEYTGPKSAEVIERDRRETMLYAYTNILEDCTNFSTGRLYGVRDYCETRIAELREQQKGVRAAQPSPEEG